MAATTKTRKKPSYSSPKPERTYSCGRCHEKVHVGERCGCRKHDDYNGDDSSLLEIALRQLR
jgi:hypothetical protein